MLQKFLTATNRTKQESCFVMQALQNPPFVATPSCSTTKDLCMCSLNSQTLYTYLIFLSRYSVHVLYVKFF
jgi:hypothetical protein